MSEIKDTVVEFATQEGLGVLEALIINRLCRHGHASGLRRRDLDLAIKELEQLRAMRYGPIHAEAEHVEFPFYCKLCHSAPCQCEVKTN